MTPLPSKNLTISLFLSLEQKFDLPYDGAKLMEL